jgi:hypothetical protein
VKVGLFLGASEKLWLPANSHVSAPSWNRVLKQQAVLTAKAAPTDSLVAAHERL